MPVSTDHKRINLVGEIIVSIIHQKHSSGTQVGKQILRIIIGSPGHPHIVLYRWSCNFHRMQNPDEDGIRG